MKCPHCDHKTSLLQFILTVMNPWRVRCPKCAEVYSIGKRGNGIVLGGLVAGVFIALGIYDKPLLLIVGLGCAYGAVIECLIWALDKPVRK